MPKKTYEDACARANELKKEGDRTGVIAEKLEKGKFPTPRGKTTWSNTQVRAALQTKKRKTKKEDELSALKDATPKGAKRMTSSIAWEDVPESIRAEIREDLIARLLAGAK